MAFNSLLISDLREYASSTMLEPVRDLMEKAVVALSANPLSIPREAIDGLVIVLGEPIEGQRLEYRVLAHDGVKMATVEVECGRCAEKDARIAELESEVSPQTL